MVKYALALLDALYTEDELKQSSFVPVGKSTTSVKPPLSPERMKLFEGRDTFNTHECVLNFANHFIDCLK